MFVPLLRDCALATAVVQLAMMVNDMCGLPFRDISVIQNAFR
jgi:hypothetical protein